MFMENFLYYLTGLNHMKHPYLLLLFLAVMPLASAAILHGTIYDTSYVKLNDVLVEVNSSPSQVFVSKEGQYSFVLEPGSYELTAKYKLNGENYLYSAQNVTISRDGYFVKDLFLTPTYRIEIVPASPPINYILIILVISGLLIAALSLYAFRRKPKPAVGDNLSNDLLSIIQKEGGRTTQKDIRKMMPQSEAKISLMISDLENQGLLKKIKKGRGNILILTKK